MEKTSLEDFKNQIIENTEAVVKDRLTKMGIPIIKCRGCGREIIFMRTKSGKNMPITLELKTHFADCPASKSFRNRNEKTTIAENKNVE